MLVVGDNAASNYDQNVVELVLLRWLLLGDEVDHILNHGSMRWWSVQHHFLDTVVVGLQQSPGAIAVRLHNVAIDGKTVGANMVVWGQLCAKSVERDVAIAIVLLQYVHGSPESTLVLVVVFSRDEFALLLCFFQILECWLWATE